MTPDRLVRTSKFLSLHLRHRPERMAVAARHGHPISLPELKEGVRRNDEQRFSFDAARTRSERWLSALGYSVAKAGRTGVVTTSARPP